MVWTRTWWKHYHHCGIRSQTLHQEAIRLWQWTESFSFQNIFKVLWMLWTDLAVNRWAKQSGFWTGKFCQQVIQKNGQLIPSFFTFQTRRASGLASFLVKTGRRNQCLYCKMVQKLLYIFLPSLYHFPGKIRKFMESMNLLLWLQTGHRAHGSSEKSINWEIMEASTRYLLFQNILCH